MKYYSPSTKGFYDKQIHGDNIPNDVIEISDQYHSELLEKQSEGYNIVFHGNNVITEKVIPTEIELANTYKYDRISEYPDMGDQLDMLYHDIKDGKLDSGQWIKSIEEIKTKYPKP